MEGELFYKFQINWVQIKEVLLYCHITVAQMYDCSVKSPKIQKSSWVTISDFYEISPMCIPMKMMAASKISVSDFN